MVVLLDIRTSAHQILLFEVDFLRITLKLLGSSIGRQRARLFTPCSGLCGYCLRQLVRSNTLKLIYARPSYILHTAIAGTAVIPILEAEGAGEVTPASAEVILATIVEVVEHRHRPPDRP